MIHKSSAPEGFTLIELSIVLVIIGLIVGGVMAGRELVKNAHIRKAVTQQQSFEAASTAFTLKYSCKAGDCADAASLGIGTASGYGAAGDGDGRLIDTDEQSNFWYHLSHAGLIAWAAPSSDPGVEAACTNGGLSTSPCLPFASASTGGIKGGWWIIYGNDPNFVGAFRVLSLKEAHYWWITGTVSDAGASGAATLLPIEAYMIDSKLDDGQPYTGNIFTVSDETLNPYGPKLYVLYDGASATSPGCVADTAATPYNTANISRAAGNLCSLVIKTGF